jgi:FKBP-type peptidyl-prolyl cis-trans isomerase
LLFGKGLFIFRPFPAQASFRPPALSQPSSQTLMKFTLPILAGLLVVAPLGAQNIKINLDKPADPVQPAAKPVAKPVATAPAATAATAPAAASEKPEMIVPADGKYTDIQKMEVYGYILAGRMGMTQQVTPLLGSEEELVAFLRGLGLAMANSNLPYDSKLVVPQTQEMIQSRMEILKAKREKWLAESKEKNTKDAAAFLVTLDAKPGVKKAASGLRYEIVQEGTGAKAKPTQAVLASYKASFIDGNVFDSSENKQGKVEFALATSIPGLKEGLALVGVGGKIKLYLTSDLGFGDSGQVLAPGVLTIFDVEILEVKEPTKQPEASEAKK